VTVSLTRVVGFHAVHRYYRPEWSEARNREALERVRIMEDPTLYADCTGVA